MGRSFLGDPTPETVVGAGVAAEARGGLRSVLQRASRRSTGQAVTEAGDESVGAGRDPGERGNDEQVAEESPPEGALVA